MTPITAQEYIEDQILMAQAYAHSQGALAALDKAEAVIKERRGEVTDGSGTVSEDYTRKIRDGISVLFIVAECKDMDSHLRTASALESGWWAMFEKLGLDRK